MKRRKPVTNLRQVHLLPRGMCCRRCTNFKACREEIVDLKGDEEICDFDPPRYAFHTKDGVIKAGFTSNQEDGCVPATAAPDDA